MKNIGRITLGSLPLVVFGIVLLFLWQALHADSYTQPTAMNGKPVPHFSVTNILAPPHLFTEKHLKGRAGVLIVWATWCPACQDEHAVLMSIKRKFNIPLYGINYKNTPDKVRVFLAEYGNPYDMDGADPSGEITMDLGVQATPEIFVINKQGRIVYYHVGKLGETSWENEIVPLVKRLQQEA